MAKQEAPYTIRVGRDYQDADSFGRDDLLHLARAAEKAFDFINCQLQAEEYRATSGTSPPIIHAAHVFQVDVTCGRSAHRPPARRTRKCLSGGTLACNWRVAEWDIRTSSGDDGRRPDAPVSAVSPRGYCRTSESLSVAIFELEHITPRSVAGETSWPTTAARPTTTVPPRSNGRRGCRDKELIAY